MTEKQRAEAQAKKDAKDLPAKPAEWERERGVKVFREIVERGRARIM